MYVKLAPLAQKLTFSPSLPAIGYQRRGQAKSKACQSVINGTLEGGEEEEREKMQRSG